MRALLRAWLVVPCLLALALPVRADDRPLNRADLDARLDKILFEATDMGVRLFNGGDQAGCYRVYQTSLMSVAPLLDHRPALQTMIRDELKKAEGMRTVSDAAFTLRKVIDKAREEFGASKAMLDKSLWGRLGGEPAVRKVVSDFLVAAAPDPKVNISRNGRFQLKPSDVERIEQRLVELISSVTGGPIKYTGRDMKAAHMGMAITNEEFDAAAGHLIAVLKKNNVPQKEIDELIGIIASTRKDIVEMSGGAAMKKSLWDRLGGEPAVTAVIDDFVGRAAGDPKVNFTRKGTDSEWEPTAGNVAKLKKRLIQLVSAVSGGPLKYEGRDMKSAHMGMKITDAEFNALAGHLKATLDKFNVPEVEQKELLDIVGSTRKDIVEMAPAGAMKKSLWDRLGGEPAVTAVIDDFVARAASNPKVNFTRKGTESEWEPTEKNVARLKKRLIQLVSAVSGGPMKYEGRDMKAAHMGMKITNAEFDALAGDLKATLDKFKVPDAEQKELLDIVGSTRKDIVEAK